MTHWLVIHEQGEEYDIEHPSDCPTEVGLWGPEGEPIMFHTCLLGSLINDAGLTDNGVDWDKLPVGRYEIEAWSTYYPSTPMGPEEWDAGIELKANEDQD